MIDAGYDEYSDGATPPPPPPPPVPEPIVRHYKITLTPNYPNSTPAIYLLDIEEVT